jgi:hypothetical protein
VRTIEVMGGLHFRRAVVAGAGGPGSWVVGEFLPVDAVARSNDE